MCCELVALALVNCEREMGFRRLATVRTESCREAEKTPSDRTARRSEPPLSSSTGSVCAASPHSPTTTSVVRIASAHRPTKHPFGQTESPTQPHAARWGFSSRSVRSRLLHRSSSVRRQKQRPFQGRPRPTDQHRRAEYCSQLRSTTSANVEKDPPQMPTARAPIPPPLREGGFPVG